MNKLKKIHKSLTIWFNGILLAIMPVIEITKESLPQLQEFLGLETYKILGLAIVTINIFLRFKTTKPLSDK